MYTKISIEYLLLYEKNHEFETVHRILLDDFVILTSRQLLGNRQNCEKIVYNFISKLSYYK